MVDGASSRTRQIRLGWNLYLQRLDRGGCEVHVVNKKKGDVETRKGSGREEKLTPYSCHLKFYKVVVISAHTLENEPGAQYGDIEERYARKADPFQYKKSLISY